MPGRDVVRHRPAVPVPQQRVARHPVRQHDPRRLLPVVDRWSSRHHGRDRVDAVVVLEVDAVGYLDGVSFALVVTFEVAERQVGPVEVASVPVGANRGILIGKQIMLLDYMLILILQKHHIKIKHIFLWNMSANKQSYFAVKLFIYVLLVYNFSYM